MDKLARHKALLKFKAATFCFLVRSTKRGGMRAKAKRNILQTANELSRKSLTKSNLTTHSCSNWLALRWHCATLND